MTGTTTMEAAAEALGWAALNPAELAAITSSVTGHPVREPLVSATPINYTWGSVATAGLWRVDVRDAASSVEYAYFVKLLRHTRLWPGLRYLPDDATREEFVDFFPWRAELDMYESGIAAVLPDGMRMPALHHVKHANGDHIALWWEFVPERPGPWRLADYRRAAYLLGRLAARRREGAEVNRWLPEVCLVPTAHGSALRYFAAGRVLRGAVPYLLGEELWQHPVVVAAMERVADPDVQTQLRALCQRVPQLLDMLDTLPQTHAHGDATPQNLLLPVSEPDIVVVIDWGFGGLLPIGFDLGQLVAGLAQAGEADPDELVAVDPVIFEGYVDGLRAERYEQPESVVRAGYLGSLAVRSGLVTLPLELLPGSTEPTAEMVDKFAHGLRLARVLLDLVSGLRAPSEGGPS
jgi:hypothetical protein